MKFPRLPFYGLIHTLQKFWSDPQSAWIDEETYQTPSSQVKKEVLYPMLLLCFVAVAVGKYIDNAKIVASIIWGVVECGILLASYHMCTYICKRERTLRKQIIDDETCNKFILYPFTIVIGVTIAHSILTSWFFLYMLLLFVVYEVWVASATFVQVDNKTRDSFFLTNSLAIIFVPVILENVIKKILVNL